MGTARAGTAAVFVVLACLGGAASDRATLDKGDPLAVFDAGRLDSWFYFDQITPNNTCTDTNRTELVNSFTTHVQLGQEESGDRRGTPQEFALTSPSLDNGYWADSHGCCSGHWWDIYYRPNPEIFWDGTPEGTFSMVVLADDIDSNARIHWLAVNIDPREHRYRAGQSGSCNWWQMLYHRCPRGRLPAATIELPNRWGWWRYTAFCPPREDEHRYRIRVFAQREWDQSYLDIRYTGRFYGPVVRTADDITRQLMPSNLAVATIIGKFQRPHDCGGPRYKGGGPADPIEGLVADYDFNTRSLYSMVEGAPALVNLGKPCGRPARFASDTVRRRHRYVADFVSGTGFAIPDFDLLVRDGGNDDGGNATEYTIMMDVNLRRTSCFARLLTITPGEDDGLYTCHGVFLYRSYVHAAYHLPPYHWHHITLSTRAKDTTVKIYIDGRLRVSQQIKPEEFRKAFHVPNGNSVENRVATGDGKLGDAPYISFFNHCGKECFCNGGGGAQSGGRVSRIQVYNKMLKDEDVELAYQRHIYKEMDFGEEK